MEHENYSSITKWSRSGNNFLVVFAFFRLFSHHFSHQVPTNEQKRNIACQQDTAFRKLNGWKLFLIVPLLLILLIKRVCITHDSLNKKAWKQIRIDTPHNYVGLIHNGKFTPNSNHTWHAPVSLPLTPKDSARHYIPESLTKENGQKTFSLT